ncbi:MAG: heme-binding protein [Actinobacteria bacterium]|nr:heme-binding protein [Actinomycetota bacterium]
MTQRQEFRVIRTYSDFELREYLPCVLAEVRVSGQYSDSSSSAFSKLFNYISKGNQSSQKIVMTAPVITAQNEDTSDLTEWYVSFVMPSDSTFDQMPQPNNSQVRLRELDTETCVAKSFRGRATDNSSRKIAQELRKKAAEANIALSSETRICRFDPPFKPGILQYNEIVIPTYQGE